MTHTQLDTIDDIAVLRALVLEREAQIFSRDEQIFLQAKHIAARDFELDCKTAELDRKTAELDRKTAEIAYKTAKIESLTLEIARLRRLQFSAKSERFDPAQRALFDEAIEADIAAVEAQLDALQSPSPASASKPRASAPVRKPLPAHLPREEVVHAPATCTCEACGNALVKIGEHVHETLEVVPAKFFVRRDLYPQFACRSCETVVAEPVLPAIIDRSQASPSLLAHVIVSKYLDHLPLYRQEAIDARSGVEIGRSTRAEWIGKTGVALKPLRDALTRELLRSAGLHADETPIQQLAPGQGKTRRAYLFAYRSLGDPDHAPIIVFDYCQSRSGEHARAFLGDWRGALLVDDFGGYKALFRNGILELGCWAHVRRKFFDLYAANKSSMAAEALQRIGALYAVETEVKAQDVATRAAYRHLHAKPLVEDFFAWLSQCRCMILGNSGTANAIDYALKRKAALVRYLEDGRWPIDNNPIENAIRPIALGRKNWLFAGSESAGQRAAVIMSLLATAKANGHCPHAWLTDVLTRLPTTLDKDIGNLLPHRWVPASR